jgi:hypothetical protein
MHAANNDEVDEADDILFESADSMDLSAKLVAALKEIFHRFDVDKDNLLNVAEMNAFSVACNGSNFEPRLLSLVIEFVPLMLVSLVFKNEIFKCTGGNCGQFRQCERSADRKWIR